MEYASIDFMENHQVIKKTLEDDEDVAFFYSLLPVVKDLMAVRMQTM